MSIWSKERSEERQNCLFWLLVEIGESIHTEELAQRISHKYGEVIPDDCRGKLFHNSRYRRTLSADIDAINWSDQYYCKIVSDNNGVKICNKEELERMIESERREAKKKLAKCAVLARYAGYNGQITISEDEIQSYIE